MANRQQLPNTMMYPLNLGTNSAEYKHTIRFATLKSRKTSRVPQIGGTVSLYMPPDALKTTYAQGYADSDLGLVGSAINSSTQIDKITTAVQSGTGLFNILKTISGATSGGGEVLEKLGAGLAKEVAGSITPGASAAISTKIGAVLNNHKALIYQGPSGFRTFNYTFSMIPESQKEADMIKHIVTFFKLAMHPETGSFANTTIGSTTGLQYTTGTDTATSLMFSYPDEFSIKLMPNNRLATSTDKQNLFKIESCFLENFTVDYSSSGSTAFFDSGDPVTTTISLQFKETQLMTRAKIREGY